MPLRCGKAGIGGRVLDEFTNRLTEVAALAHAAGSTLSGVKGVGGSLTARNVTFSGTVLDLGTSRNLSRSNWQPFVAKDLKEITDTARQLSSLVHPEQTPDDLASMVHRHYLGHLEAFGAHPKFAQYAKSV